MDQPQVDSFLRIHVMYSTYLPLYWLRINQLLEGGQNAVWPLRGNIRGTQQINKTNLLAYYFLPFFPLVARITLLFARSTPFALVPSSLSLDWK